MSKLKRKGVLLVVMALLISMFVFSGTAVASFAAPARTADGQTGMTLMYDTDAQAEADYDSYVDNEVIDDAILHIFRIVDAGNGGFETHYSDVIAPSLLSFDASDYGDVYAAIHNKYFGVAGSITGQTDSDIINARFDEATAEVKLLTVKLMFQNIITTSVPAVVVGSAFETEYTNQGIQYANHAIGATLAELDTLMEQYFGQADTLIGNAQLASLSKADMVDELDWILAILAVESGSYLSTTAINRFNGYRTLVVNADSNNAAIQNYLSALEVVANYMGGNYNSVEAKMRATLESTMKLDAGDANEVPAIEKVRYADRETIFEVYRALSYLKGYTSLFSQNILGLAADLYERALHTYAIEIEVDTNEFTLDFVAGVTDILVKEQVDTTITYREFYLKDAKFAFSYTAAEGFDLDTFKIVSDGITVLDLDFDVAVAVEGVYTSVFADALINENDWKNDNVVVYPGIGAWDGDEITEIYTDISTFTDNEGTAEIVVGAKDYFIDLIAVRDYATVAEGYLENKSGTLGRDVITTNYVSELFGFIFDDTLILGTFGYTIEGIISRYAEMHGIALVFDGYRLWNDGGVEVFPEETLFTEADTRDGRITIYARFVTAKETEAEYIGTNHSDENISVDYDEVLNTIRVSYDDVIDADLRADFGTAAAALELFVEAPASNIVGYNIATDIAPHGIYNNLYNRPTTLDAQDNVIPKTVRHSSALIEVGNKLGATHEILLDSFYDLDEGIFGNVYTVLVFWYGLGGEVVAVSAFNVAVMPYETYSFEFTDAKQSLTGANVGKAEAYFFNLLTTYEVYTEEGELVFHQSGTEDFEGNDKLNINIGDKKTFGNKDYIFGGWMMEGEVDGSVILSYQTFIIMIASQLEAGNIDGGTGDPVIPNITSPIKVSAIWYELIDLVATDVVVLSPYGHTPDYITDEKEIEDQTVEMATGAYVSVDTVYNRTTLNTPIVDGDVYSKAGHNADSTGEVSRDFIMFFAAPQGATNYTFTLNTLVGNISEMGIIEDEYELEAGTPTSGVGVDAISFAIGELNGGTYNWSSFEEIYNVYDVAFESTVVEGIKYWIIPVSIAFADDDRVGEAYEFTLYYRVYNEYTVTFEYNDGTTPNDTDVVIYGNQVIEPADPTRAYHDFMGWQLVTPVEDGDDILTNWEFTVVDDTDPLEPVTTLGTPVTGNITLRANWNPWKYSVSYGYEDDEGEFVELYSVANIASGAVIPFDATLAKTHTPAGYAFAGWKLSADATAYIDHTAIRNATVDGEVLKVYADWVEITEMAGLDLDIAPEGMTGVEFADFGKTSDTTPANLYGDIYDEDDNVAFVIDFEDVVYWNGDYSNILENSNYNIVIKNGIMSVRLSMLVEDDNVDTYYVVTTNSFDAIGKTQTAVATVDSDNFAYIMVPVAQLKGSTWVPYGTQNRKDAPITETYYEIYFYDNGMMVSAHSGKVVQYNYQDLSVRFDFNYKVGNVIANVNPTTVRILYGKTIEETMALRDNASLSMGQTGYVPTATDVETHRSGGYDFLYWELSTNKPTPEAIEYPNHLATPVTRNHTLVAVNDVKDVTVEFWYFNPNLATPAWVPAVYASGTAIPTFVGEHDDYLAVPAPSLEGYTFTHWTTTVEPETGAIGNDFFLANLITSGDDAGNYTDYLVNHMDITGSGKIVLYAYFAINVFDVTITGDFTYDSGTEIWTAEPHVGGYEIDYNTTLAENSVVLGCEGTPLDTIRMDGTSSFVFDGFWFVDGEGNYTERFDFTHKFIADADIAVRWIEIGRVVVVGGLPTSITNEEGLTFDYAALYNEIVNGTRNRETLNQAHFITDDITEGTIERIGDDFFIYVEIELHEDTASFEINDDANATVVPYTPEGGDTPVEIRIDEDGNKYIVLKILIGEVISDVAVYGGTDYDDTVQIWAYDEDELLLAVYADDITVADYLEFLGTETFTYGSTTHNGYITERVHALWEWVQRSTRFFDAIDIQAGGVLYDLHVALGTVSTTGTLKTAYDAEDADAIINLYRDFFDALILQSNGYTAYTRLVAAYNALFEGHYSPGKWNEVKKAYIDGCVAILSGALNSTEANSACDTYIDAMRGVDDLWDELVTARNSAKASLSINTDINNASNADRKVAYEALVAAITGIEMPIKSETVPAGYESFREIFAERITEVNNAKLSAQKFAEMFALAVGKVSDLDVYQNKISKNHKYYRDTLTNIWAEFDEYAEICAEGVPTDDQYLEYKAAIELAYRNGVALIERYKAVGWQEFVTAVEGYYNSWYTNDTLNSGVKITRAEYERLLELDAEYELFTYDDRHSEGVQVARGHLSTMLADLTTPFTTKVDNVLVLFDAMRALAPNYAQTIVASNASELIVLYKAVLDAYMLLTPGEQESFNYRISLLGLKEIDENYPADAFYNFYEYLCGAFDAAIEYGFFNLEAFNTLNEKTFADIAAVKAFYLVSPIVANFSAIDGQVLLGQMGMQMFADDIYYDDADAIGQIAHYLDSYDALSDTQKEEGDFSSFLRYDDRANLEYLSEIYLNAEVDKPSAVVNAIAAYLEDGSADKIEEMYKYSLGIFKIEIVVTDLETPVIVGIADLVAGIKGEGVWLNTTATPVTEGNTKTYTIEMWFDGAENTVTLGDYTIEVSGSNRFIEVSLDGEDLVEDEHSNEYTEVEISGWELVADSKGEDANVIVITADIFRYNITFVPNIPLPNSAGTVVLEKINGIAYDKTIAQWYEGKNGSLDGFDAFLNPYTDFDFVSHTFVKWVDENGNEFFLEDVMNGATVTTPATKITEHITLYGVWEVETYTVTVVYNDSTTDDTSVNTYVVADIPWGYTVDQYLKSIFTPGQHNPDYPTPEKPDRWEFEGWYLVEAGIITGKTFGFNTTEVKSDLRVSAFWTEIATTDIWLADGRTSTAANTSLLSVEDHLEKYDGDTSYTIDESANAVFNYESLVNWSGINSDATAGFVTLNGKTSIFRTAIPVYFNGVPGAYSYKVTSDHFNVVNFELNGDDHVLSAVGADAYVYLALASYAEGTGWTTYEGVQTFIVEALDAEGRVIVKYTFTVDVHKYVTFNATFVYRASTQSTTDSTSIIPFIYGGMPKFSHIDAQQEINLADEKAIIDTATPGYSFLYWYSDSVFDADLYVDLTEVNLYADTTYYAFWQKQTFSIRFYEKDGVTLIDEEFEVELDEIMTIGGLPFDVYEFITNENYAFAGFATMDGSTVIPFLTGALGSNDKITSAIAKDYIITEAGAEYGILNLKIREVAIRNLTAADFGIDGTGMKLVDYNGTVAMEYKDIMDWAELVGCIDEDCTDDPCVNPLHNLFRVKLTLNDIYRNSISAIDVFDANFVDFGSNLDMDTYYGELGAEAGDMGNLNKVAYAYFTIADLTGARANGTRRDYEANNAMYVYYFDANYNIIGFGRAIIGLKNYETVTVNFDLSDARADIGTAYEYGKVTEQALYGNDLNLLDRYNARQERNNRVTNVTEIYPKNNRTLVGFMLVDGNGTSLYPTPRLYLIDESLEALATEKYPSFAQYQFSDIAFTGTMFFKAIYDAEDMTVNYFDFANAADVLKGTKGYSATPVATTIEFSTLISDIRELSDFAGYDIDNSYWTASNTWSLSIGEDGVLTGMPEPFDFENTYIADETNLYAFYMPHEYIINYYINSVKVDSQTYYYGYVVTMPSELPAGFSNESILACWVDGDNNRYNFDLRTGDEANWEGITSRELNLHAVIVEPDALPKNNFDGFNPDFIVGDSAYTTKDNGYFEFSFYVEGTYGTAAFDESVSYIKWQNMTAAIAYQLEIIAPIEEGTNVDDTMLVQIRDGETIQNLEYSVDTDLVSIIDFIVSEKLENGKVMPLDIERTFIFVWFEDGVAVAAYYLNVKMVSYYDAVNQIMVDMMESDIDSKQAIIDDFAPIVAHLEDRLDAEIVAAFSEWLKGSFSDSLDRLVEEKLADIVGGQYLDETKQTIRNAVNIFKLQIENATSFTEMCRIYEEACAFIASDIMDTAKIVYTQMLTEYYNNLLTAYGLDATEDAELIAQLKAVYDAAVAKIGTHKNFIDMDNTLANAKADLEEIVLNNLKTGSTSKINGYAIPEKYKTGDEYAGVRKLFEDARADALAKAAKATTNEEVDAIYAELVNRFAEIETELATYEKMKSDALNKTYLENLLKEVLKELINNPARTIGSLNALSASAIDTLVSDLMKNAVEGAKLSDIAEKDIRAAVVKYINTIDGIDAAIDPSNGITSAGAQLMADLAVILNQEDARDRLAAAVVVDAIDDLGKKAKKGDAAVVEAREKYDALTDRQKSYVTNLHKLENIENPSNLKILVWITIILLILLIIIAIIILILVRRKNNDDDNMGDREEQPKVETKREDPKPVTPARDTYIIEKTTVIEKTVGEKKNEDDEVEFEDDEIEDDEVEDEIEDVEEEEDDEVEPEEDGETPVATYNYTYVSDEPEDEEAKEKRKREPRKTFSERLVETHMTNKYYYSMIKNELLSYRTVRSRMSKTIEKFNSGRIPVAKMNLVGKTLRLYIALNPADYDETIYHHKNVGDKRKYELTPLMMKVKSERSLNKAVVLIAEAMSMVVTPNEKPVVKRKKFQEVDYVVQLRDSVATPIGARGMGHLIVNEITADGVDILPDYDATKCVEVREIPAIDNPVKENVSIETLEANFRSGEIIDLRALLKRKIVPTGTNFIKITSEGKLTKVFTIVANSYATAAIKMVALIGGIPVRLKSE